MKPVDCPLSVSEVCASIALFVYFRASCVIGATCDSTLTARRDSSVTRSPSVPTRRVRRPGPTRSRRGPGQTGVRTGLRLLSVKFRMTLLFCKTFIFLGSNTD